MSIINVAEIEKAVRMIIKALNDNPDREGLKDTPTRVAAMYAELFEGMFYTNEQIAEMHDKCFEEGFDEPDSHGDMVILTGIPFFSFCEHHLMLMYNMQAAVAYIPKGKVIGLSKIARVVDLVSRRLQLQERIGSDVADIIQSITGSDDVAVVITGEHGCMTARGIKKPGTVTTTSALRGRFRADSMLRSELMALVNGGK